MLETKKPPGDWRSAASFFSATFANPSIVSAYISAPNCPQIGPHSFLEQMACQIDALRYPGSIPLRECPIAVRQSSLCTNCSGKFIRGEPRACTAWLLLVRAPTKFTAQPRNL